MKRLTAIVHMDVQLHYNRPQGSRFELHVPASMVREGDSHSAPIPLETPFQLSLEGLAVLCVDDDPSSLAALVNLVSDWGCTVIAAQSPEDAIAKCRRRTSIDVVLSDQAVKIEHPEGDALHLRTTLKSGRVIVSDRLLSAAGRGSKIAGLNLAAAKRRAIA